MKDAFRLTSSKTLGYDLVRVRVTGPGRTRQMATAWTEKAAFVLACSLLAKRLDKK
jgi:hypothetical protein